MAEYRQNAYIAVASVLCGGSVTWWSAWGVAVGTASPTEHRAFWTLWSYLSLGPMLVGLMVFAALILEWPLPGVRSGGNANQDINRLLRRDWKKVKRARAFREAEDDYRARSVWHPETQQAALSLERQQTKEVYLRVRVTDPTGFAASYSGPESRTTITLIFPDQFAGAPSPLVRGEYTVDWEVAKREGPSVDRLVRVATSQFRYSHKDP